MSKNYNISKTIKYQKNIISFLFLTLILFSYFSWSQKAEVSNAEVDNLNTNKASEVQENTVNPEKNILEKNNYASMTQRKRNAIYEYVDSLTVQDRIAQLFIMNINGNETCPDLLLPVPGMYLFFSYNIAGTPEKIIDYTSSINEYFSKNDLIPPFLVIDHEGGDVNRLRGITSPLPSERSISTCMSKGNAGLLYYYEGCQLRALGFNINLAPVVECENDDNKDFLGTRSFGDLDKTIEYSSAAIIGYKKAKIGCVLKHFPGNTNDDPHTGLPIITAELDELENIYIKTFSELTKYSPFGTLISHAVVPAIDQNVPACFSEKAVNQILKKQCGFAGLVFSDDIYMGALLANNYTPEIAAELAISAGVDVIMISVKSFGNLIDYLSNKINSDSQFAERVRYSAAKVIAAKIGLGLMQIIENNDKTYTVKSADSYKDFSKEDRMNFFNESYNCGYKVYNDCFNNH